MLKKEQGEIPFFLKRKKMKEIKRGVLEREKNLAYLEESSEYFSAEGKSSLGKKRSRCSKE